MHGWNAAPLQRRCAKGCVQSSPLHLDDQICEQLLVVRRAGDAGEAAGRLVHEACQRDKASSDGEDSSGGKEEEAYYSRAYALRIISSRAVRTFNLIALSAVECSLR